MKDIIWVFQSFGFIAGIIFIKDMVVRRFRKKPKRQQMFEELSDEAARSIAWAFGIYRWTDRKDLNRQWNDLEQRFHTLH